MRLALVYSLLAIAIYSPFALAQTAQQITNPTGVTQIRFGLENLDPKTDPCVDFYQYACGGWMASNPIPADEIAWGTILVMQRWNESILHDVLEKASSNEPKRNPIQRKIGDYYAACMDEKGIDATGLSAIQPELERIARIKNKREFAVELAHLHKVLYLLVSDFGAIPTIFDPGSYNPLFGFFRVQDFDDASKVVAIADQGGIGLSDRDYYLKDDKTPQNCERNMLSIFGRRSPLPAAPILRSPQTA